MCERTQPAEERAPIVEDTAGGKVVVSVKHSKVVLACRIAT